MIFRGLDDNEKIKSISNIDDIVIEEATELTLEDFTQLNLRLRSRNPYNQIYLMYNPVSKANWVFPYWHESDIDNDTTFLLKTTYRDNKFLPTDYIESIKQLKEKNPTYYRIYANAEFCTLDELIFDNWQEQFFETKFLVKLNPNIKARFGLDFGYTSDPTAFIGSLVDEDNKKIYIFDEFYQRGLLNNEIADLIKKHGYQKEVVYADAAEPKSIEEIRRHGVPRIKACTKGKDSILQGIQYLQQYDIVVHPKCTNIIEELQNYTWMKDKQTSMYINKPIDKYNHLIDALRYSVSDMYRGEGMWILK